MAGRGRGATLPAWMTAQQSQSTTTSFNDNNSGFNNVNTGNSSQFDDAPNNNRNNNGGKNNNFSNDNYSRDNRNSQSQYDDRKRQRSRSPARDNNTNRSRRSQSPQRRGGDGSRQPRTKRSNFDVGPAGGSNFSNNQGSNQSNQGSTQSSNNNNRSDVSMTTRHARRIYASGLPPKATEQEIQKYFNDLVTKALLPKMLDFPPVIKIYLNVEKSYAFVEFDSIELTTACLKLDGVKFDHYSGTTTIRVRRPNDYRPDDVPPLGPIPILNLSGTGAEGANAMGPDKIFIGGLPYNLTDDQIMELLQAFGPVKNFNQVRDANSLTSKGYAFVEYYDQTVAEAAIAGLSGLQLGEKALTVKFASQGGSSGGSSQSNSNVHSGNSISRSNHSNFSNYNNSNSNINNYNSYNNNNNDYDNNNNNYNSNNNYNNNYGNNMNNYNNYVSNSNNNYNSQSTNNSYSSNSSSISSNPTRVLRLSNMVTPQDLQDDAEYADIREDVRLECCEHGQVIQVLIPRRKDGYNVEGSIFVEFGNAQMAKSAFNVLHGRKFSDKTVVANYFDEMRFSNGMLN